MVGFFEYKSGNRTIIATYCAFFIILFVVIFFADVL